MNWSHIRNRMAKFGLTLFISMFVLVFLGSGLIELLDGKVRLPDWFDFLSISVAGLGAFGFMLSFLGDNTHGGEDGGGGE
jgi:hypothetical protein